MGKYITTKCPYCKYTLDFMSPYIKEDVGHPANVCPMCKEVFKTGMKYWFEMDSSDKTAYIVKNFFTALWSGIIYSFSITFLLFMIFSGFSGNGFEKIFTSYFTPIVVIFCIFYILFVALIFRKIKMHIKKYSNPSMKKKLYLALQNRRTIDFEDM